MFSRMAVLVCIPTSSEGVFLFYPHFYHILFSSGFLILAILKGCGDNLLVVFVFFLRIFKKLSLWSMWGWSSQSRVQESHATLTPNHVPQYAIVALIYISLMLSNLEHLFIGLLAISLWRNVCLCPLSIFKIGLFGIFVFVFWC